MVSPLTRRFDPPVQWRLVPSLPTRLADMAAAAPTARTTGDGTLCHSDHRGADPQGLGSNKIPAGTCGEHIAANK
jgi:hypothetical protein